MSPVNRVSNFQDLYGDWQCQIGTVYSVFGGVHTFFPYSPFSPGPFLVLRLYFLLFPILPDVAHDEHKDVAHNGISSLWVEEQLSSGIL